MRVLLALAALPLAASFAPSAVGRRFNHPRHATDCECDAATGAATVGTASVTPALLRGLSLTNAEGAVVELGAARGDGDSLVVFLRHLA
jgi:hypothetical protein